MSGPYSIGSEKWNGLSKLVEECGEVMQVCGKIIAIGGHTHHWDGSLLDDRVVEELGDLMAAMRFFAEHNGLDLGRLQKRSEEKHALFERWNAERL